MMGHVRMDGIHVFACTFSFPHAPICLVILATEYFYLPDHHVKYAKHASRLANTLYSFCRDGMRRA